VNRDLLEVLVRCSFELQQAHKVARAAGREDICQQLREAAWKVAAAIGDLAPDRSAELVS
jgi:hypothetical protein